MGNYIPVEEKKTDIYKKQRIGTKRTNNQGIEMIVIQYNNYDDITVQFSDGYIKQTRWGEFEKGNVNNPNFPKIRKMPFKEQRMSEIVINKEGYPMRLAEYNRQKDVVVEFLDEYHAKVHTDYRFFRQGGVKNPNRKGQFGERLGNESPTHDGKRELKIYNTWRGILHRVNGQTEHSRRFYDDVKICEEWLYYTNYYNWAVKQENYEKWEYNVDGIWAIDKDILSDPFNKIYSPETCCFVPDYINSVVVRQRQKDRNNKLPLGIQYYKYGKGKYFYQDKTKDKRINVYFDTLEEAIVGYKEFKKKTIRTAAEYAYSKGDITKKCYDGLLKYDFFAYENINI